MLKIRSLGIAQYIAVRRDDLITIGRRPADGGVQEMTDSQKREIANLRANGNGYGKIALALGISQNTVKSYCRRNNIGAGPVSATEAVEPLKKGASFCECCGKEIHQVFGHKIKRFCSDACRNKWWNSHLDLVKRKAVYKYKCPGCGREFEVYGNSRRKYCSHECYIADRFGGVHCG